MVTNVSSLLKTVRSVEDEAQRGLRAIESTVDAVKQAVIVSCRFEFGNIIFLHACLSWFIKFNGLSYFKFLLCLTRLWYYLQQLFANMY